MPPGCPNKTRPTRLTPIPVVPYWGTHIGPGAPAGVMLQEVLLTWNASFGQEGRVLVLHVGSVASRRVRRGLSNPWTCSRALFGVRTGRRNANLDGDVLPSRSWGWMTRRVAAPVVGHE